METRNTNSDSFRDENNRHEDQIWTPTVDSRLHSQDRNPDDDKEYGNTHANDPAQKPNTGDWGDERDFEENEETDENLGNDNSGGAGSTGSESTNSGSN